MCDPDILGEAIRRLTVNPKLHRAADWPLTAPESAHPGLYAWYVDSTGALDLTAGLNMSVNPGLIYAGQAGATRPKSGKQSNSTLKSRIGSNYIRGNIAGSTLRRTLTACLRDVLSLDVVGPKQVTKESEEHLTRWICQHLSLAIFPIDDRDGLLALEDAVLRAIDPPLNLDGCAESALRMLLKEIRRSRK